MKPTKYPKDNKFLYGFSSYGVKFGFVAFSEDVLNKVKREVGANFPFNPSEIEFEDSVRRFFIEYKNGDFLVINNGKTICENPDLDETVKVLERQVFLTIAEFAKTRVFIHAGAVGYKNKGVIFPADSYQGKSTLTAELVKAGADYYSDDCAVLDENGLLHPFAKKISMRGVTDEFIQTDFPVEHFGGRTGTKPVEVKLIVLTEFEKDFEWSPELLSQGNAILQILRHTVSISFNPESTINVLQNLVDNAIIVKSKRGNAKSLISYLFNILEKID